MHSKKIIGAIAFSAIAAAALTACGGGGGGSAWTTTDPYVIDMEVLPGSVLYTYPETGYARNEDTYNGNFEAQVAVHVRKGADQLAPNVQVECHTDGVGTGGFIGLGTVKAGTGMSCDAPSTVPAMTYNISGTTSAGVYKFHFHAGNTPTGSNNVARIVCRVIDPSDGVSHQAVQDLTILPFMSWDEAVASGQKQAYIDAVGCTDPGANQAPATP